MSEWIESHVTLPRNKKFRRLARSLGTDTLTTLGLLHALWYYTLEQSPSGFLNGHTAADIAEGCYYDDDPDKLLSALVKEEWVDKTKEGLFIHDWQDYNRQHRERQRAADRQAAKRARDRDSDDISQECHGDVTVTSRTKERKKEREERKTEEERAREPVENLVTLALTELPTSESTKEDYRRTIERYQPKLTDDHIERIIVQLGNWRPPKPRPKLHLTLAQWLNREARDPLPPAHQEWQPPPVPEPGQDEVPMPENVRRMVATMIGRSMR